MDGHVRTAAEVDERAPSARGLRYTLMTVPSPTSDASTFSMMSCLYGWSANTARPCSRSELVADERLVLGDDLAHPSLDPLEVVVAEVAAVGKLEVVVEAVLDRRTDRVPRTGIEIGDGLRQHVRRRVAQHLPTLGARGDDDLECGVALERRVEIDPFAVERGRQGILAEPLPDRRRDVAPPSCPSRRCGSTRRAASA